MGKLTSIEWCDSTVNPTGFQCCGCELWRPKQGVKQCYAGRFAERVAGVGAFDKPVMLKPGRMAEAARWSDLRGTKRKHKPWLNGSPRVIFIGDMADVLQPRVSNEYLRNEVINNVVSELGRRHIWMLLTKQSSRLVDFYYWLRSKGYPWPSNLWPGVSVTDQLHTYRIPDLLRIESQHRFISYEPAWGPVDFSPWTSPSEMISMIIVGGQSGPGAKLHPFNVQWAIDTVETCDLVNVHCFVKQLGSHCVTDNANLQDWPLPTLLDGQGEGFASARARFTHPKGGNWFEWPSEVQRREFPEV
jgi:protein gp37